MRPSIPRRSQPTEEGDVQEVHEQQPGPYQGLVTGCAAKSLARRAKGQKSPGPRLSTKIWKENRPPAPAAKEGPSPISSLLTVFSGSLELFSDSNRTMYIFNVVKSRLLACIYPALRRNNLLQQHVFANSDRLGGDSRIPYWTILKFRPGVAVLASS
ncbi:hypothetical protein B0T22DRAFT_239158 [Podospora appendiculata]|uniref:Uncharacterized protein n=1 Tax=Podospora appendiculata TaxID=314037 RepID=A0AAE0X6G1_9PEZI|nr:hypothetical protein B0T22DRAFT_239158 [Podospora appendiculata]